MVAVGTAFALITVLLQLSSAKRLQLPEDGQPGPGTAPGFNFAVARTELSACLSRGEGLEGKLDAVIEKLSEDDAKCTAAKLVELREDGQQGLGGTAPTLDFTGARIELSPCRSRGERLDGKPDSTIEKLSEDDANCTAAPARVETLVTPPEPVKKFLPMILRALLRAVCILALMLATVAASRSGGWQGFAVCHICVLLACLVAFGPDSLLGPALHVLGVVALAVGAALGQRRGSILQPRLCLVLAALLSFAPELWPEAFCGSLCFAVPALPSLAGQLRSLGIGRVGAWGPAAFLATAVALGVAVGLLDAVVVACSVGGMIGVVAWRVGAELIRSGRK
mmetsp:Transcript_74193/g.172082  ORF Transcript_74193/g.172082 Transcript_74193/m.172082 type:complete len:338 (+) Transcript_74193:77-1090(+)